MIASAKAEKRGSPSVPPRNESAKRSGCGIIPRILPSELKIPAILSTDPLGLDD